MMTWNLSIPSFAVVAALSTVLVGCGSHSDDRPDGYGRAGSPSSGGRGGEAGATGDIGGGGTADEVAVGGEGEPGGGAGDGGAGDGGVGDGGAGDGGAGDGGAGDGGAASGGCVGFVGGELSHDTTLTEACGPYTIESPIDIVDGATLTIEAGARLRFEEGVEGVRVGNAGGGRLIVEGTRAAHVVMTSATASPIGGSWGGLSLYEGTLAGSEISYLDLEYCGLRGSACILNAAAKSGRVSFDHLSIDTVGGGADGIVEADGTSPIALANSSFRQISEGQVAISLSANAFASVGASNSFDDTAAIELRGGTVDADAVWLDPGTNVNVTGGISVGGEDSPVLTLGAGLVLQFATAAAMTIAPALDVGFIGPGSLRIEGTEDARVLMTSSALEPKPGDWCGVFIRDDADADISYADIRYGGCGGGTMGNITLQGPNSTTYLSVTNSRISDSLGYGVFLGCQLDSEPKAEFSESDNLFENNLAGDIGPGFACDGG